MYINLNNSDIWPYVIVMKCCPHVAFRDIYIGQIQIQSNYIICSHHIVQLITVNLSMIVLRVNLLKYACFKIEK